MSSFDGNYFMRRRVVIISLLIVLHFKVIPWGAGACLQSRDKFYTKNMHLGHIYMSDDNAETTDSTMTQKWVDLGLNCSMPTESPFIETWKLLLGCFRNCATFLRAVKAIDKAGCLLDPGYQPWVYAHYLCCDRAPRRTWLRTPAFILNQKFEASDSACDPSLVGTAC